jgi:hypothetical protein
MINQYSAPKDSRLTQCELILSRLEQIRQWLGEIESPPPPTAQRIQIHVYLPDISIYSINHCPGFCLL